MLEPERTLVLRDRGRIVAGTGIFSRRLTVPGGEVPAAGVTLVGVRPTHRRRGLLTTLMRRQLADIHDAGREPVAALWASEPVIYGRFGYGLATFAANLEVRTREVQLRRTSTAQVDLLGPADALDCHAARARGRAAGATRHARPRRSLVGGPAARPRERSRRRPAAARRRHRGRLRPVRGQAVVHARRPGRRGPGARGRGGERRGRGRDLGLPPRPRPHHQADVGPGARRRPARAHGRQRARRALPSRRRALGPAGRPPAGAERAQLRGAVRGRARGRRRGVPVERRPLGAALGRVDRDVRARRQRRPRSSSAPPSWAPSTSAARRSSSSPARAACASSAAARSPPPAAPSWATGRPGARRSSSPAGTIGRAARAARARPRRRARWRGRAAPRCRARASP